ncbi:MAG: hypothetical protein ACI94Y_002450 [Maribacter sp.]|jgi:hypothetical protein
MKKSFSILILFFFLSISVFGQTQDHNTVLDTSTPTFGQVYEKETVMSKGNANSFSIDFSEYSPKNLEYEWKKFIKSFDSKAKKDKKTKELFAENVIIKEISNKPLNIYAAVTKVDKITTINIWFYMDSFFIKSSVNEQESSAIYDILSKFFTSALLNKMERDLRNKEANTPKLLTGKKTTRY